MNKDDFSIQYFTTPEDSPINELKISINGETFRAWIVHSILLSLESSLILGPVLPVDINLEFALRKCGAAVQHDFVGIVRGPRYEEFCEAVNLKDYPVYLG